MDSWYRIPISILALQFFIIILDSIVSFDFLGKLGEFYLLFLFTPVLALAFGLLVTKRKYRLPRKHFLSLSLVCACICMVMVSIRGIGSVVSQIIILILLRILFGIGLGSAISINVTIFCSLYTDRFQVMISLIILVSMFGSLVGYAILTYSITKITDFSIAFAVLSVVLIPFIRISVGELQYSMTAKRYTALDFLKKSVIFT